MVLIRPGIPWAGLAKAIRPIPSHSSPPRPNPDGMLED
jgi:hypothetical protein